MTKCIEGDGYINYTYDKIVCVMHLMFDMFNIKLPNDGNVMTRARGAGGGAARTFRSAIFFLLLLLRAQIDNTYI